jgi:hypothetical protein
MVPSLIRLIGLVDNEDRHEEPLARDYRLPERLNAGENILVHCRGGLGRAGMIAARSLVETGVDPEDAMK